MRQFLLKKVNSIQPVGKSSLSRLCLKILKRSNVFLKASFHPFAFKYDMITNMPFVDLVMIFLIFVYWVNL